jgi:hypothetical protein
MSHSFAKAGGFFLLADAPSKKYESPTVENAVGLSKGGLWTHLVL